MHAICAGTGLYHICGWDLRDDVGDIPRTLKGRIARRKLQLSRLRTWLASQTGKSAGKRKGKTSRDPVASPLPELSQTAHLRRAPTRQFSQDSIVVDMQNGRNAAVDPSPVTTAPQEDAKEKAEQSQPVPVDAPVGPARKSLPLAIWTGFKAILTPPTLGVMVSLPFALVQPLKALVVPVEGWSGTIIRNAPDGSPPLAFFYDVSHDQFLRLATSVTKTYTSVLWLHWRFNDSVGEFPHRAYSLLTFQHSGGLIILGATFARIKFSKEKLREMPYGAIAVSLI